MITLRRGGGTKICESAPASTSRDAVVGEPPRSMPARGVPTDST